MKNKGGYWKIHDLQEKCFALTAVLLKNSANESFSQKQKTLIK
ncbi:hypothetical protein BSBH6_03945 [Bacillus subtilis]|nr:hypothetical protein BSBH6_03945 [Bacillus subtilis]RPK20155.1 hypothetical protein BH5_03946 [Bacillus subtilis]